MSASNSSRDVAVLVGGVPAASPAAADCDAKATAWTGCTVESEASTSVLSVVTKPGSDSNLPDPADPKGANPILAKAGRPDDGAA
ncbi:hypothetical protein CCR75_007472 [Bremia lactucae]|uniref:Uncharacterized protein n=1 Tax=Bremia lactucae TaxID=4779 RepID=A0A976FKV5_BRELC|nr:hypothetical protein CCR75_007472 [Bremia lactucae]